MEAKLRKQIRRTVVLDTIGCGLTKLNEMVADGTFPAPITLSPGGRAIAWFEDEVIAYQQERAAERDAKVKPA
jgi:predicted DNA-binding transcriptional regulator AlpA